MSTMTIHVPLPSDLRYAAVILREGSRPMRSSKVSRQLPIGLPVVCTRGKLYVSTETHSFCVYHRPVKFSFIARYNALFHSNI